MGGLPRFLGGFLDRVFDRQTGVLLDVPCGDSIFAIRQLTLMFSKILLDCSEERQEDAIAQYIQCEKEVKDADRRITPEILADFRRVSALLWSDVLAKVDLAIYNGDVVPKHGPGKTADGLLGNEKFDQLEWPARLERVFPFGEYAIPSWRSYYLLDRVTFLEPGRERPAKVVLVPKTLKTPRIIAIEPTAMQYMQQAVAEILVDTIESTPWIRSLIGFDDQIPNQEMAKIGSLSGKLATLDLSEASDRVSNQLVLAMMQDHPHLSEGVQACRSRKADVPGYGVQRLAKFASMGSALCFPIEAMVFLTTIFMGIERGLSRRLTRKDIKSYLGKVRVYGDDIIVPTDTVHLVVSSLETFGFKVNTGKSFWTGKFRESCGKEYYDGRDVSITKVRRVFPARRGDVREMISLVSLRNQLYFAGLWNTSAYLDKVIGDLLPFYPVVDTTSPVLGRHSFLGYNYSKMCTERHTPLVKGYVVKSVAPHSPVSGEGALLKWFLKRGDEPFADRDHLERQGRSDAVNIKLGWFQPF